MKKYKLFIGILLLASSLSLVSCGSLTEDNSDTSDNTSDTDTKDMKYEVGNATIDSWTDCINTNWVKIAVPVKNTGNTNIYVGDMSADIESSTGTLLKTVSMISAFPEYIKPGETAYYYDETTVDFDTSNMKGVPHVAIEKPSNDVIRYDLSEISITADTYFGVKVMGRVENKTSKKGTLVYVAANLFDSNDKLICNCFTILENDLNAGDKVGFTCKPVAYTDFTPTDVARYEIYSYPTQFNIDFSF